MRKRLLKNLRELPKENILLEPVKKNTAPACTFGTLKAEDDEVVLVVPADHYIPDKAAFWNTVERGVSILEVRMGL